MTPFIRKFGQDNKIKILGSMGLAGMLLVGALFSWIQQPSIGSHPLLVAIRARGEPVTPAELQRWHAIPAESSNAALIVLEATKMITSKSSVTANPTGGDNPIPDPSESLPIPMLKSIQSYLACHKDAIQLLQNLANRSQSRFPVDYSKGMFLEAPDGLSEYPVNYLLSLQLVEAVEAGNLELAMRAMETAFAVHGTFMREPDVWMHGRGISGLLGHFRRASERLLTRLDIPDPMLVLLQQWVVQAEYPEALERAAIGWRTHGVDFFLWPIKEQKAYAKSSTDIGIEVFGKQIRIGSPGWKTYRYGPAYWKDFDFFLTQSSNIISALKLPYPDRLAALHSIDWIYDLAWKERLLISSMYLRSLGIDSAHKDAALVAWLRLFGAALAVERYRNAHVGQLPLSLKDLCPSFIPREPMNPLDGGPMYYERLSTNSYRIHSGPWLKAYRPIEFRVGPR